MKNLRSLMLGAVAAAAFLTASAVPSIAQVAVPDKLTLTLTPQEVNAVGIALMQRPYSEVADLMNKLNDQVKKQTEAANPPKPEPAPVPTPPDKLKK